MSDKHLDSYLGETVVNQEETIFKDYSSFDWAMYFIERYGGYDGSHHKDWVLDQVARIYSETSVIIKLAKWESGKQEYRISLGEPTEKYKAWVAEIKYGEDGPNTYDYEKGVAP